MARHSSTWNPIPSEDKTPPEETAGAEECTDGSLIVLVRKQLKTRCPDPARESSPPHSLGFLETNFSRTGLSYAPIPRGDQILRSCSSWNKTPWRSREIR